jgi:hypothetical protein
VISAQLEPVDFEKAPSDTPPEGVSWTFNDPKYAAATYAYLIRFLPHTEECPVTERIRLTVNSYGNLVVTVQAPKDQLVYELWQAFLSVVGEYESSQYRR